LTLAATRSRPREADTAWIEDTHRALSELADEPVRATFLRRAISEVLSFAQQDRALLLEALASPAPVAPLLRSTTTPAVDTTSVRWARARQSGREAWMKLLEAEGGTLTSEQVAERLGRSRQAVHQRQRKGQLLAVAGPRGVLYPVWQFSGGSVLEGLADILEALGDTPAPMAVQFFLTGRGALEGDRPLDALRAGRVDDVKRAAAEFAAG
jgi:hypothetical protein